jgi:hypothetical protein
LAEGLFDLLVEFIQFAEQRVVSQVQFLQQFAAVGDNWGGHGVDSRTGRRKFDR